MSDDFKWQDNNEDDDANENDEESFGWQRRDDDESTGADDGERTGVTGQLSWRGGTDDDGESTGDDDDSAIPDIDWETGEGGATGDDASTGVTGMLSWQKSYEDAFERQLDEAEQAALDRTSDDDEADHAPPTPAPDDTSDDDDGFFDDAVPDWLGQQATAKLDENDESDDSPAAPDGWVRGRPMTADDPRIEDVLFDDDDELPDDDVPDWLSGIAADDAPETPAFADDDDYAPTPSAVTGELPDWLVGDDADDDADDAPDDDVPDWLGGIAADDAPETPAFADDADYAPTPNAVTGELPDWLVGDDADEEQEPAAAPVDESLFDDSIDWLEDDPDPAPVASDAAEASDDDVDLNALPDWLQADDDDDQPTPEDDALSALFAGDDDDDSAEFDLDSLAGAPAPVSGFDEFSEDDFISELGEETDDDFELLGDLSSKSTGFTGMLGEDDDATSDDDDDFDLFGELAGDDQPPAVPAGDSADGDDLDDVFASLFPDEDAETPIADSVAEDDDFFAAAQAEGFGASDDSGAGDDPFRDAFFGEGEGRESQAADADDLDWLSGVDDAALFAADDIEDDDDDNPLGGLAPAERQYADVDEYLAGLAADDAPLVPVDDTALGTDDLDFDALFGDERLAAVTDEQPEDKALSPDAPDWLVDLSEGAVGAGSAAALARQQDDRPLDELDDRLKELRQRGLNLNIRNVTGDTPEIEQIIPGVSNTLPAVVFDPGDVDVAADLLVTDDQRRRADVLNRLTGAQVESDAERPRRRRLPRIFSERLFFGLLLLGVMVLPFLTDVFNIGGLPPAQFMPDTVAMTFFDKIELIENGDLVLIAAEYSSSGGAELDEATAALLRHVLARGGVPVIVSGNAIGLLRAERAIERIAAESDLTRNVDYVIGAFLVGDVVGLRNFSQNVGEYVNTDGRGDDTGLDVSSLDDFRLIVVVVENAERARAWGEQAAPLTRTDLIAIAAQGAAPLSEPYFRLAGDGIAAYITGYREGVVYEHMVGTLIASGGEHDFGILPTDTPTPTVTNTPIPSDTPIPTDTPPPTATPDEEEPTEAPVDEPDDDETPEPVEVELTPDVPTDTPPPPTATLTPQPPSATPTSTPEVNRIAIVAVDSAVNVRGEATTSAAIVGALGSGARSLVLGELTNDIGELWYNIRFFDEINGLLVEGWLRSDLVTIEVFPGPVDFFIPTPDGSASGGAFFSFAAASPLDLAQDDPAGDPDDPAADDDEADAEPELSQEEVIATLTAIPMATATARAERTPGLPVIYDYDLAPMVSAFTPTPPGPRPLERDIAPPELVDRSERWFSMTLGLTFAVVVIVLGGVFNISRAILRRKRPEQDR